jgi:hypothetical protein
VNSLTATLAALRGIKHATEEEGLPYEDPGVIAAVVELDIDLLILLCEAFGQEVIDTLDGKKKD